jgi:transcriptional regulator with PAS, ATPase and Fis domain
VPAHPYRHGRDGAQSDYVTHTSQPQSRPGIQDLHVEHPRFYESLIEHSGQIAVVLGFDSNTPLSFGGGSTILRDCLDGPDAAQIATALDVLLKSGAAFERRLQIRDGRSIKARGVPVGRRVVLYFEFEASVADADKARAEFSQVRKTLSEVIQAVTLGIAILDSHQRLVLYNDRYSVMWDLPQSWLDTKPSLGAIYDRLRDEGKLPQQRDFIGWKQKQLKRTFHALPEADDIWHLPRDRTFLIQTHPTSQGGSLLVFEDLSENLTLETSLNLLLQVQQATLDTLDEGAAIFGPNGRLFIYNERFACLWDLPRSELSAEPHLTEIALLSATRYGNDDVWGMISNYVNSSAASRSQRWERIRRVDGKIFSLSVNALPNGATIAIFTDLTDLERFQAMQCETEEKHRTDNQQVRLG